MKKKDLPPTNPTRLRHNSRNDFKIISDCHRRCNLYFISADQLTKMAFSLVFTFNILEPMKILQSTEIWHRTTNLSVHVSIAL